jgi:hypothetical protein
MPKVTAPLPNLPGSAVRPGGGGEGNKDRLLADLRRQVNSHLFYIPSSWSKDTRHYFT